MNRTLFFILLFVSFSIQTFSQEMWGMVNSNYAGVTGLHINPSSMVASRYRLDINLLAAGFFLENDYLYWPKEEFNTGELIKTLDLPPTEHRTREVNYDGAQDLLIQLPSFAFLARRHAFGLVANFRATSHQRRMPYHMLNFLYEGFDLASQQNVNFQAPRHSVGILSWAEVGINYGTTIKKYGRDYIYAGITVKKLWGIAGTYFSAGKFEYLIDQATNTLQASDLSALAGTGTGGSGFGLDLGVTFAKKEKGKEFHQLYKANYCKVDKYKYRLGFSILDVGRVKHKDGSTMQFESSAGVSDVQGAGGDIEDITVFASGGYTNVDETQELKMRLPTALSVQFDYRAGDKFYINSSAIYGLPSNIRPGVKRPHQISVTPRYEARYFEAAMPVSLMQFGPPRIGLALRLAPLWIGSDKVGEFLGISDVTGMDIYLALKLSFHKKCAKRKRRKDKSNTNSIRSPFGSPGDRDRVKTNKCPGF